jgi:hypothetical protein
MEGTIGKECLQAMRKNEGHSIFQKYCRGIAEECGLEAAKEWEGVGESMA